MLRNAGMSRRKQANRAEAIVRGVGAMVMLLVLLAMVSGLPNVLKGKDTQEMLDTLIRMIAGFAALGIVIGAIGLLVWFWVLKGKRDRRQ